MTGDCQVVCSRRACQAYRDTPDRMASVSGYGARCAPEIRLGPTVLRMLVVEVMARFPALKPTIRAWLLSEWPDWYGAGGPGTLVEDVEAFARSETLLPVGFVVFAAGEPVGFGALKQESIPSHSHLSPWAATGYVKPSHRRQGVGAILLGAIVGHAKTLGFPNVYCGTSTAGSLLERAGWQRVEQIVHAGQPLGIFRSGA